MSVSDPALIKEFCGSQVKHIVMKQWEVKDTSILLIDNQVTMRYNLVLYKYGSPVAVVSSEECDERMMFVQLLSELPLDNSKLNLN